MKLTVLFCFHSLREKDTTSIALQAFLSKLVKGNIKLFRSDGFTLIEALSIVVVLSILGLFTFSFIEYAIRTYLIGTTERMIYQDASYTMERMTRELRDMINPVSWSNGITYDALQFSKRHGTPQDVRTDITYWRDANTKVLYRQSGGVSQPIGQNVTIF